MTFPPCCGGSHFNGFRKFFGTQNSITVAMTISLDLVISAQSDAPILRRQFTEAFLSMTGSLLVKQLMANELALEISWLASDTGVCKKC